MIARRELGVAGISAAIAVVLCLSPAQGAPRENGGDRPQGGAQEKGDTKSGGKKSVGGAWSDSNPAGKQGKSQHEKGAADKAAAGSDSKSSKSKTPQASGAQGAAGAAAKNQTPQASGAQGAAGAAQKRNARKASAAAGAAAGGADATNKTPQTSGAKGAAAGAAIAKRNAPAVAGAARAAAGSAAVRNSFDHPELYGHEWYGNHPGVWSAAGWAAGAAWSPTVWGSVASYGGYGNGTPFSYDYGGNVLYADGNVLVDGQNMGTAEEFGQQAADLAQTGADAQPSDTEEWLPLGVFALVRNEQQHPQLILQMAINRQGILRGNYTDEVTEHTQPIHGAVDQKTQRAAWTVGGDDGLVMEAGLSNLTTGEARVLLHKKGKTQQWLLVRLEQPDQGRNEAAPADAQE